VERRTFMSATEISTGFENITYEVRGSIGYITLNRPKVMNALNRKTVEELNAAFHAAKEDAAVKGIILTGVGEKAFIAGADIAELSAIDGDKAGEFSEKGQEVLLFIETLGKPVIAAVNGFALGGGCETAMACTIRIAAENAKFGQPEVKLGIIPGYGGTQRLPRLVGKGRALQLILTGDLIDAHEAYRIGLVNEVVSATDLISRCEAILKQIGANAPLAIRYSIDAVNEGVNTDLTSGLKLEAQYFTLAAGTADRMEGTSAFVQKRAPQFQGK
jgi:enoyl-CoA hydratase